MAKLKCLEVRINSVDDARACVQHGAQILAAMRDADCDGVELLIAQELKPEVAPIIAGAFSVRQFTRYIKPGEGNIFYPLPPFFDFKPAIKPQRKAAA
jgi:hypothetical protein